MANQNKSKSHCEQLSHFAAYADKYVDGDLTEKEISELFEHAEGCPECRRYLEITVKTEEAVDVPDMTPPPRGLHAHIMASVKTDAAAAKIRAQEIPRISRFVPFAAAFLCIFLVAAFFMSTPTRFDASSDKFTEDALQNGAVITKPETDGETPDASPPTSVPDATDVPSDNASVAEGDIFAILDSESITFIIFGLCAIFALSSVAALAAFVFAAKKKQ